MNYFITAIVLPWYRYNSKSHFIIEGPVSACVVLAAISAITHVKAGNNPTCSVVLSSQLKCVCE
jgi:hypothetical protein